MRNPYKSKHVECDPNKKIIMQLISDYCTANGMQKEMFEGRHVVRRTKITDVNHPSLDRKKTLYINIYRMKNDKYIIRASNHATGESIDFASLFSWKSAFLFLLRERFKENSSGKKVIEDLFLNNILF